MSYVPGSFGPYMASAPASATTVPKTASFFKSRNNMMIAGVGVAVFVIAAIVIGSLYIAKRKETTDDDGKSL